MSVDTPNIRNYNVFVILYGEIKYVSTETTINVNVRF